MNQEKIGKFIAKCRKEKNLTQEQFGKKLGVTYKSVSKWENGRSLPDPSLYKDLCNVLGISLTELFNGDYIETNNLKEKADEVLFEQISSSKKKIMFGILSSIMQGIGVALLFIPIYKSFSQNISAMIVAIGFILYVIGTCLKIRR